MKCRQIEIMSLVNPINNDVFTSYLQIFTDVGPEKDHLVYFMVAVKRIVLHKVG